VNRRKRAICVAVEIWCPASSSAHLADGRDLLSKEDRDRDKVALQAVKYVYGLTIRNLHSSPSASERRYLQPLWKRAKHLSANHESGFRSPFAIAKGLLLWC
jgi:hypothetical protein